MTNPFEIILSDSEMKKKLVQGFKKIFSSVYENLPNRWVSTIMYKNNKSFPIWGVADYDINTNEFKWSPINRLNTNYSALEKLRNFLYYDGVKVFFSKNPLDDRENTLSMIDRFLTSIDSKKQEYIFDGDVKNTLIEIMSKTWDIGSNHTTILKKNYKKYFTEAINIDDKGDDAGDAEDMLLGIDNTIMFPENIIKTTQNKGCKKIVLNNDEYHVYCTVDYEKYKDTVNYFVFFPANENDKIYIFENNKDLVKNIVVDNLPVFVINSKLKYYVGDK